ncbi:putative cytochrome [Candidatus Paraburkholderia kirkii]|nr:putative cytochrome [Candidatus Paraburkholderia kirkii]
MKLPRDRKFDEALIDVHRHIRELMARTRARMREEASVEACETLLAHTPRAPRNLLEAMLALRDAPGSGITDDEVARQRANDARRRRGDDGDVDRVGAALSRRRRYLTDARRVLGDAAVCPGYGAMRALDLCEALCTEASRLHPVAPYLSFEPLEEVRLQGVRLPAGTKMFLLHRPAMMDPRNFANPERFDPDRWVHEHRHVPSASPGGAPTCSSARDRAYVRGGIWRRWKCASSCRC